MLPLSSSQSSVGGHLQEELKRSHRPWYKRAWRLMVPDTAKRRPYILAAFITVVVLSILVGMLLAR